MKEIEMSPLASRNLFVLKPSGHPRSNLLYLDIFDPATSDPIMECREERIGWFGALLRDFEWKSIASFDVIIRTTDNKPVLRVKSCGLRLCPRIEIYDEQDSLIGQFQQRSFSWRNSFRVVDAEGEPVCSIVGVSAHKNQS